MTQTTFIETYKIEAHVCDKIISIYEANKQRAQPGRLGENPRVDKQMKDSMDISIHISQYGHCVPFFELLQQHVSDYIDKFYYDTGAVGFGQVGYSNNSNIQWYPAGGGYPASHCERDRIEYSNRVLAWMLYL